jgi:hypothetical protein
MSGILNSVEPRPDKNEIMLALDLWLEHDLRGLTAPSIIANQAASACNKQTKQTTCQHIQLLPLFAVTTRTDVECEGRVRSPLQGWILECDSPVLWVGPSHG